MSTISWKPTEILKVSYTVKIVKKFRHNDIMVLLQRSLALLSLQAIAYKSNTN